MKKNIRTRVILLTLAVFVSTLFFLPSTPWYSAFPPWWKKYLPSKGITLGLDLQGGIHLILEVEEDKAVENLTEREFEVFHLIGRGLSTRQIANQLSVSVKTVEVHRLHIKEKLHLEAGAALMHYAMSWESSKV